MHASVSKIKCHLELFSYSTPSQEPCVKLGEGVKEYPRETFEVEESCAVWYKFILRASNLFPVDTTS